MYLGSLHLFDLLVILSYLGMVIYIGRRAAAAAAARGGQVAGRGTWQRVWCSTGQGGRGYASAAA